MSARRYSPGDRVIPVTEGAELGLATVQLATPTGFDNQMLTVVFDTHPDELIRIGAHLVRPAPVLAELGRPVLVVRNNVHPLRPRGCSAPPWGAPRPPSSPPPSAA